MSRSRRLAFLTAVNIDGALDQAVSRDDFSDHWVLDPRIPADAQLDNVFYAGSGGVDNPLDRGHLVRRLDPCWGATRAEVIAAHHDTFHWTNSSPQHLSFNRSAQRWLGIEDHVLKNANARDLRATVFSGPVLREDDPVYTTPTGQQVQLPTDYWKVVVFVRADGQRSATGYLLSQEVEVDALTEAFDFGDFNGFQVPLAELEELTGLTFLDTQGFDPLEGALEGRADLRPRIPLGACERLRL
jgi:endonuclease G